MSEVYDVDDRDGWAFGWDGRGGRFELEWLPSKQQWLRHYRSGNVGSWSTQTDRELKLDLEAPFDHADARRIAKLHSKGRDLP